VEAFIVADSFRQPAELEICFSAHVQVSRRRQSQVPPAQSGQKSRLEIGERKVNAFFSKFHFSSDDKQTESKNKLK